MSITVDDPSAAIDFYRSALEAEVVHVFEMPGELIAHADLKIGNAAFYFSGEFPEWNAYSPKTIGGSPNLLCIHEEDCDSMFEQAIASGGEVIVPMQNNPWGTRSGVLLDLFGYRWNIGKVVEELTQEEILERMQS